jgi:outer membrane protein assembly factor BamD
MIRRHLPALALVLAACLGAPPPRTAAEPALRVDATNAQLDEHWARAEGLYRAGRWASAATELERLGLEFTSADPRMARARFYLAECYFQMKSHLQAVREFRRVSDELPSDPLAPDALLRAGDAFADLWRRPELDPSYAHTAISTYQEVQNRYPGTHASQVAQIRINELNDRLAMKQYRAALYYLKYKADDSAILYIKDLATAYPRAKVVPEALVTLIGIYQRLGYTEDIRETCGFLRRFHPQGQGVEAACAAPAPSGRG